MTINANDALKYHANLLKGWHKAAGTKPTGEMLATVMGLGARPGKQCLANAMALRPEGVTGAQIVLACGAPQLNKMRDFVAKGLVKMAAAPVADNGHKVYRIELTAKGSAKADNAAPEKAPVKKAAKKARKAPAKVKAPAPVNEAPAITAPAPVEAPAH